jgi:surfactin synthase thioesterase subunit
MSRYDFLLIRGLARESAHWGGFKETLEAQDFVGQVMAIDLPGAGHFCKLTSPITIGENAEFLISQLPEKTKNPLCIVSISLGSMVAIEMCQRAGHRFHQAYLLNTSVANLSPIHHRLQLDAWKRLLKITKSKDLKSREREILKMVSREPKRWPELSEQFAQIAELRPMKVSNVLRQLIAAATYRVASIAPSTPMILMNSEGDQMVDPRCSKVLSDHWSLPLLTHPNAGHDLTIDAPDWVVEQIKNHLS